MSRFLDFDQPIFFTPPSGKESGPRRLFKGGGSSGTPYYAQQDRLFGTQADISQQLYNQYAEMAPTYLANTQGMVDDAMDGTLSKQMQEQAGNNATATMGAALDANNRSMQRYGMGFNANRLLTENNRNAIMGAAQKAGAMNQASMAAEDQKWNRNAGAYGQIAGMGTGAMSGMGSAGAGYGNMGNAAQAGSMANAQGFGKFGSAIAGIGMGYADGGEVKKPGLHLASGAYVRQPFVNHLKPGDWRSMPTSGPGYTGTSTGDALGMMAMGMVPGLGMLAVKDLLKGDKSTIRGWTKDLLKDDPKPEVQIDKPDVSALTKSVKVEPEVLPEVLPDLTSRWSSAFGEGNYASGGPVKRGLCLASGGYAQPTSGEYETDPDRFKREGPSAADMAAQRLGSSAMGAATNPMTYIKLANDYGKLSNAGAAQDRLATAQANYDQTLNASQAAGTAGDSAQAVGTAVDTADAASSTADAADTINAATDLAEASNAADAASKAADGVGGGNPVGSVIKLGADLASGRDAGEAVADAALGYGGAELGATIGSAAGPVGTVVGGLLGGLLGGSIFKDGGKVSKPGLRQGRKNLKPGGKVKGPGTETSDDIPAWLSDGEIVENADAVKLAGKDALLEINDAGLEVRDGKATPEEAQTKIGQVMIQRGKELAGGSRFVKRGVKLAGGGFLGGNLGVALGAGVDQYNVQSERNQQKEQADRNYELQKQNNDRLNKIAEQQSTEFQWKTKDRQKADSLEQALNSAGERMTEATALQGRLNELSKDEAKAAYDAYAQAGMTPKELIGKGASEVGKIDMAKGLAFKNTAEGELYSQTFKQLTERNAPFEEKLRALSAISPEKGMTLETQHKDTLARIEANKLAKEADERYKRERDAQIAELRREQIAARSGGAGSKSGSGKGAGSDGMKPDDLRQAFIASIPDDGFARLKDGKAEFTLSKPEAYSQATARLGSIKKLNPSMDENALINASLEATKFHNGIAPNGTVGFELDGKGNFVPTLMTREATGNRKVVIGDPVPFSQIGSIDPEKLKLTNTTAPTKEQLSKAEMQWNIQSLQEAKAAQAKFSTMTPQQVASLDPETRKRLQNLDADIPRLEALVSAYAEPANREARGAQQKTPVASKGAKQVTAPAFSDKEMQAASNLGVKAAPTSPNYKAVLDKAGDLIGADKNAFVKNVITQLNAGRLQQGDAIATVLKIKEDPNVEKLFSDDQIWALQVAAGKRI